MSEREEIFITDEVGSVKEGTNGVMSFQYYEWKVIRVLMGFLNGFLCVRFGPRHKGE